MQIIRRKSDLSDAIELLKQNSKKIGFVPTMGALHQGHLSLIDIAKEHADIVVSSIFVNPTQFGENEDFDSYPKKQEEDLKKLEEQEVDIVYLPTIEEIYPDGASSDIKVNKNADILCGKERPGHFDGVATVVKRLFEHVAPKIAVFGEKDYQQLIIIKQLVKDHNIPVEIIGAPIIREDDGLAMSSRNDYLSEDERKIAPELFKILSAVKANIQSGQSKEEATSWGIESLKENGFEKVDYLEIHDLDGKPRIFTAAHLGNARLIDNLEV